MHGAVVIAALPVALVALWVVFPAADDGSQPQFLRQALAELVGASALLLFACVLLLATRARFIEPWFGGLDKMYVAHRVSAVVACGLMVLHALVIITDPVQVPPGRAPGTIALYAMLVLVLLAIAPRLPLVSDTLIAIGYRSWRRSHKLTGLFFVMAFAHWLLVDSVVARSLPVFALVFAAGVVGTVSYVYLLLFARFARRPARHVVAAVRQLDDTTVEVTLQPLRRTLSFTAGQFVFVRFKGDRVLAEPHPFTVSSSPREPVLRLVIRAAGDFTGYLVEHLRPDTVAVVEGSYGKLDHRRGGARQIWIAGGIGVTPFLSWIRDLNGDLRHTVDLFYTVRRPGEELFVDEMRAAARRHDGLRLHVIHSSEGRLTVERIAHECAGALAGTHVYMCGPTRMIGAFRREFRRRGVPRGAIHVEEFNFR